ncbi:40S ribosomal protein S9, partial [Rhizoctonia solani AG-3 Rhs1AP]
MPRAPRNHSKTYKVPHRPFESARLGAELKMRYAGLSKMSVDRRLARWIIRERLGSSTCPYWYARQARTRLDYVLASKIEDFLEPRLQTQVFKFRLAKSIHHARVLIGQRHIRVGKQIVNVPSFVHIDFALTSPYGGGRKGRIHRKRAAAAANKNAGGDEEEEE